MSMLGLCGLQIFDFAIFIKLELQRNGRDFLRASLVYSHSEVSFKFKFMQTKMAYY